MRVAFVGKGGSGKSTIAGTIARLLARDGDNVLALDVDTLPGLAFFQLEKLPGGVKPPSTVAFRHVVDTFRREGWSMVARSRG